ncbi:MAG: aspartate aminotransferase family protein [Maricaulaceae bacterium]|nr:aspartate aminotransferase family protein [Maricaulaceae bacterium]
MPAPLMDTYSPPDLVFTHGEGAYLFDDKGGKHLDFIAGIAVNSLGHAHPKAVAALKAQADKLWHLSNMFRIPGQVELAKKYCDATFAERVFFTNSGTEAIECALKTARRYHFSNGRPDRYRIISFTGAFHGRSYGAINAGGNPKYLEGFGPRMEGFDQVEFGDLEAVKTAITEETAAIIIEPVQGEGGLRAASDAFLRGLRALCDEHGLLLIYDEVQSGAGRTGRLFAHEWSGAAPDIMAVAKGVGGGFPMGACLATEAAGKVMVVGTHGTTFGGNPLAMAVGNAVFDELTAPGFMDRVVEVGNFLGQQLHGLADAHAGLVQEVRGRGLLLGLKLDESKIANRDFAALARARGLLIGAAGDNVARLAPPLIITENHAREAVEKLDAALHAVTQKA